VHRPDDNAPATIAVDRKADVPVGVQLGWALCAQIGDGSLLPGERLPTLRQMAERTGLNVNTVRAVYRRLEQRGLVESQHGSGTFVAAAARSADALSSIAAHAAQEARETGVDPREVAAVLYIEDAAAPAGNAEERSEQTRRRSLRSQIAAFERTIAELEAQHPGVAPAPAGRRRGIGPALLTASELAQVRAGLIRRLTVVQAAIDAHLEQQRGGATTATPAPAPRKAKRQSAGAQKKAPRARASTRPAPAGG
jgi:DNA-binding transcriptional regulator YhcF (GntR family)